MTGRARVIAWLQGDWLGRSRVNAYSRILLIVSLASFYNSYRQATGRTGSDFLAFWSAGKLAVAGMAERVYDLAATGAVQAGLGRGDVFAFVNPPPFLLLVWPLGYLGFVTAWVAWIAVTYALWLVAARQLDRRLVWPIAAFPGALVAGWHAQTGLLTGALILGAGVLLPRRPVLAGLCIGALVIKPHLALLFPVALLAGRHWSTLWSAAATALGLVLLTAALFGPETLTNYPQSWQVSRFLLEHGSREFFLRQCTPYAAIRVFGSPDAALAIQAACTLGCVVLTWRAWSLEMELRWKMAVALSALPLATPYLFSYDLAFLVLPVIWLIGEELDRPRRGWERPLLLCLYLSPLWTRALALPLGVNLGPAVQAAMLWHIWKRPSCGRRDPQAGLRLRRVARAPESPCEGPPESEGAEGRN